MSPYITGLTQPATGLLETFSPGFIGPFKVTQKVNRFLLIVVEHLRRCPLVTVTWSETCENAISFVREEILAVFGSRRVAVSDNGPEFVAKEFWDFLKRNGAVWKPFSAYAPQASSRTERMVGTTNNAIAKVTWTTSGE